MFLEGVNRIMGQTDKMVPNKEINTTIQKYRKNYTILLDREFCGGKYHLHCPSGRIKEFSKSNRKDN